MPSLFLVLSKKPFKPLKVGVTSTTHGNRVTGNEVGRSEKVTGDEPGTCKSVTGTPYAGLEQASQWCDNSLLNKFSDVPQMAAAPQVLS